MTDLLEDNTPTAPVKRRRTGLALAAAALVIVGGAGGAAVMATQSPSVTMAPATPVAINTLSDDGIVTVRGKVAEIYGNKFILADGSGRALIDAGREGEGGKLVAAGEPVTVQGRFDNGSIHAAFLVRADGKVTALGPLGRPGGPEGPGGPRDRHGPPHDRDGGPDAERQPGPPPVAAAPVVAPAPASAPAPAPAPSPTASPAG
jgi:uncharacterized protein YdeI (BOF family)